MSISLVRDVFFVAVTALALLACREPDVSMSETIRLLGPAHDGNDTVLFECPVVRVGHVLAGTATTDNLLGSGCRPDGSSTANHSCQMFRVGDEVTVGETNGILSVDCVHQDYLGGGKIMISEWEWAHVSEGRPLLGAYTCATRTDEHQKP